MRPALIAFTLLPAVAFAGPKKNVEQYGLPALPRDAFNRLAIQADLPLFWVDDRNKDQKVDPDELQATGQGKPLAPFVARGKLTPRFERAYRQLVELRRREAVRRELDSGRPTILHTDFSGAPPQDKALLREILAAAKIVEQIYWKQTGAAAHLGALRRSDPASQMLFWRNHGPWCQSPATRGDRFCNALPSFPPRRSGAYPDDLAQDDKLCKQLQADAHAKQLLDPFTVVRKGRDGKLVAVPYNRVFAREMRMVAGRLKAAARAAARDPKEKALERYLLAAAAAFESNSWGDADEAWAAMSSQNSKWYLRIGPDEVYADPCQQKAGFHVSFARIDPNLLSWQKKLTPLRSTMEHDLARLIGKPYQARKISFHMPDFIRIILNAGDSRHPMGGTIGQSLPNWGKVAREGRGRTVVMTNLYTDPDSQRIATEKARALLDPKSMRHYSPDPNADLINIILHEATHNFGPHSDYRVKGKVPKEIFGGKVASTLEELKAQTGGLWFLQLLQRKGMLDKTALYRAYTAAITWAFSHISRGMFSPSGNVQPYSQLAAIQIGSFMQDGAMTFNHGRFTIHFERLPRSIERLMATVGKIKATGDRAAAEQLIHHFIDPKGRGHRLVHEKHIANKLLRYPKGTFVYSVVY
jgi:hypothetical protein